MLLLLAELVLPTVVVRVAEVVVASLEVVVELAVSAVVVVTLIVVTVVVELQGSVTTSKPPIPWPVVSPALASDTQ